MEQERLQLENTSLHADLTATAEKVAKVQRCYRQVEQENMNMAEELREMERDRVKLYEHKMKLQVREGGEKRGGGREGGRERGREGWRGEGWMEGEERERDREGWRDGEGEKR